MEDKKIKPLSESWEELFKVLNLPANPTHAITLHKSSWSAARFSYSLHKWHNVACEQNSIIGLA